MSIIATEIMIDNGVRDADFFFPRSPADPRGRSTESERLDLGILGFCGPRTDFGSTSSKILGFVESRGIPEFLDVTSSLFLLDCRVESQNPRIVGYQVHESRKFFGPVRILGFPRRCQGKVVAESRELDRSSRLNQIEDPRILSAFAKRPLGSAR